MKTIYSEAQFVSIWLGEAEGLDETADAMDIILTIPFNPLENRRIDPYDEKLPTPWDAGQVTALRNLLDPAYWQRVLIVQEVILAKGATILCGSLTLDMARLTDVILNGLSREGPSDQISTIAHSPTG